MTHTNTEGLSDAVTREDAIKFLEGACRNWSKVPRLSEEDIGDVASELLRFALSRRSASNTGGVEVKAAALAQAYLRGVEWRDENPGHVDYAYRFKAAGDYADKATSSLAAEAEPVTESQVDMVTGVMFDRLGLTRFGFRLEDVKGVARTALASINGGRENG